MYDNPEDYAEVVALAKEVATTLPVAEARPLGSIGATTENGWVVAELSRQDVGGGDYDWWNVRTLCLTTGGDLVVRETAWYSDDGSSSDTLRPATESDLHLMDWPWSETTGPHEGAAKGTQWLRGHWIYGHERVAANDFDGVRSLLESRRV